MLGMWERKTLEGRSPFPILAGAARSQSKAFKKRKVA